MRLQREVVNNYKNGWDVVIAVEIWIDFQEVYWSN